MARKVAMLTGIAGVVLIALGTWVVATWILQRAAMFPRPPAAPVSPAAGRPDVEILRLGPDGVEAWYLPPRNATGPAPLIIFTHGNGELIDYWLEPFSRIPEWGVGVLLVEYPGYGRSGGQPSERAIGRVMADAYDVIAARPEVDGGRIVGWGRSLGGAAACSLADQRDVAALILESTFTGVRPLARRFGLIGPLVRDPFDNLPILEAFAGPVLVLHGEHDSIVPVAHGRALAQAARASELHLLPCGHNDCPQQWPLIRSWLERQALLH
jgi:fermentation-respiration switch protein FrsA (DUF1100 family)